MSENFLALVAWFIALVTVVIVAAATLFLAAVVFETIGAVSW